MSENVASGVDSPSVIEVSGSGGFVEKDAESVYKQDSNWEPYQGPRGGTGWRNTETDEVVYSEVSPAGDTFDENEGVGTAEPDEDDSDPSTPDSVSDSVVDVDRSDVERDDYISIDGEKEGFVDLIERRGDDVYVRFESGDGMWLEEDMDVYVDDDPPSKSEDVDDRREYLTRLKESANIEERSPTSALSNREITDVMSSDLTRVKNSDVIDNTFEEVQSIKQTSGTRSYYDNESGNIAIATRNYESTVSHELGHAMVEANGFTNSKLATVQSMTFDRDSGFDESVFTKSKKEMIDQLERAGSISETQADILKDDIVDLDEPVQKSDLMFKLKEGENTDEIDEDFTNFISTLNDTYMDTLQDVIDARSPGSDDVEEPKAVKDEYEFTTAHEFFAMVHENLQQEGINRRNLETIYEQYPEVLDTYFEVFEPNDLQKRELNQLFNESGGSGPIESEPFSEVQE